MESAPSPKPKPRPDPLLNQLIAERYQVDAQIGAGGMGAVYRGRHIHMHKAVAIKVLHREMTAHEEARKRFEREAIASARIEHPHVTAAKDFGKLPDGSCYLVLDYISGESLKTVLRREGKFEVDRALKIVRQITEALEAAHAAGVIHRDLKPDNVMLVDQQGDPEFVKVLDFGIAKLESRNTGATQELTRQGAVFGTPEYMSPEQAGGSGADGRADLYAIGVMLFELLCGKKPFQAESAIGFLTQHMTKPPPPLPDDIPLPVRQVVERLLKKSPAERFQSATELLIALEALEQADSTHTLLAPSTSRKTTRPFTVPLPSSETLREAASRLTRAAPFVAKAVTQPVSVRGRVFPAWQPGAVLLGALLLVWLLFTSSGDDAPGNVTAGQGPGDSTETTEEPTSAAAGIDLDAVRRGDPEALAELDATPRDARSADQWLALGFGRFHVGQPISAIAAFQSAMQKNPKLETEAELRALLYRAAITDNSSEAALAVIANELGSDGADFLYQLIHEPPAELTDKKLKKAVQKRARAQLETARDHASPALAIALQLEAAKGCKPFRDLLETAQQHADERSLRQLRRRTSTRGCGLLGLGDCFDCLRSTTALRDAIRAAEQRPAPAPPKLAAPFPSATEPPPAASTQ